MIIFLYYSHKIAVFQVPLNMSKTSACFIILVHYVWISQFSSVEQAHRAIFSDRREYCFVNHAETYVIDCFVMRHELCWDRLFLNVPNRHRAVNRGWCYSLIVDLIPVECCNRLAVLGAINELNWLVDFVIFTANFITLKLVETKPVTGSAQEVLHWWNKLLWFW